MEKVVNSYRSAVSRTGSWELFVHAAIFTYACLLFSASMLNMFAPKWVSRNAPMPISMQTESVAATHSSVGYTARLADEKAVTRCLSRGLMHDISHDPVVERVKAEMNCGCRVPEVYEPHETPTVCAIVQSFNHEGNVEKIARALVSNPVVQEIIICEDGSTDGSLDKWMEQLRDHKHFIVVSNNLHETRCYNRAMRMSSAEFFVLMQDDDLPSEVAEGEEENQTATLNWVSHALELFDADPKLSVVTGFIGQMWARNGSGYEFGEQTSDHGGTRKGKTLRIPFLSSRTLHPFMYVECAWIAPLFVRSESLKHIGGLDVGLFGVGEPGVWQDCVLSYAAWTAGWRVGVYDAGFTRGVGGHGSTSSPEKTKMRDTIWKRAKTAVDSRYDRGYIHNHVLELNSEKLLKRYDSDGKSA